MTSQSAIVEYGEQKEKWGIQKKKEKEKKTCSPFFFFFFFFFFFPNSRSFFSLFSLLPLQSLLKPLEIMADVAAPVKGKVGVEEGEQARVHKIRITLSSRNVKNLEKGMTPPPP